MTKYHLKHIVIIISQNITNLLINYDKITKYKLEWYNPKKSKFHMKAAKFVIVQTSLVDAYFIARSLKIKSAIFYGGNVHI